jgi:Cu+-exporting ATPase
MQAISEYDTEARSKPKTQQACYHCGAKCLTANIAIDDKLFCCEGCKLVYEIINNNGLCDYYALQSHPGLSQIKAVRSDKFAYLDDEAIANKLYQFNNADLAIVTLYLPAVHCSSCMWLLEHLNRLDAGITESRISFTAKEVTIHFSKSKTTLRKIAELLTTIGYEPYISLQDASAKELNKHNKTRIIKLGVAGFCFGNIMMMSFPEYLAGLGIEEQYAHLFRYLNLLLSLPVFFYSATEFYSTAWAGLKQKILNIDAPIVLALVITFSRSLYEILTNTGAGYLDSMSGIVFFMLAGRIVQDRTYKSLSFTRDYKSYFPIAVNVKTATGTESRQLEDLREKDRVLLHHGELVPADSLVINGRAMIDYSFVTGEAEPVTVKAGETVYAGGKQTGEELEIEVIKPIASSYLTSLWNHYAFKKDKADSNDKNSIVHILSRYFTVILFSLALGTAAYWYMHDASKIINAVSAMLIVACPCALLLSATFTNSNILRIFGLNGLFLRDATVIEQMANADEVVFDKTGTITTNNGSNLDVSGHQLTELEKDIIYAAVKQSNHPNSKALAAWIGERKPILLEHWEEHPGKGVEVQYGHTMARVGSAAFTGADTSDDKATVYIRIGEHLTAVHVMSSFRDGMPALLSKLKKNYVLALLSGDNEKQKNAMRSVFGPNANLQFEQKPIDKLQYIQQEQASGRKVMMIGDGLNDAGALQQSNVGITLADDVNNFTPACDAILRAEQAGKLSALLELSKVAGKVVNVSFVVSIMYNMVGLYFSMQGLMKPVTAAILMPCSTVSIVILSSGLSNLIAWRKGLKVKDL